MSASMSDSDDISMILLVYCENNMRRSTSMTVDEFNELDKQGFLGDILVGRLKGIVRPISKTTDRTE